MRITADTRGRSYWDLIGDHPEKLLTGQINLSVTAPYQCRGFHLHKKKTDYWFCLEGELLVVLLYASYETQEKILTKGSSLVIQPGIWHAYQCISDSPSILLYYETEKSGANRDDDFELPLNTYNKWLTKHS